MEFRIMTYNIYGARLANGKKLAKSIKKYKPDFVALQEVDKNTKRSNFRDVTQDFALELGYNYYYFQKAMDFDKGEFGISFVSKYDVKNIYVHELPSAGNEKRQVLAAQISSKYKKHKANDPNQTSSINNILNSHKELYTILLEQTGYELPSIAPTTRSIKNNTIENF